MVRSQVKYDPYTIVLNSTAGKAIRGTGFHAFFQNDSGDIRPRKMASWLLYVCLGSSCSAMDSAIESLSFPSNPGLPVVGRGP